MDQFIDIITKGKEKEMSLTCNYERISDDVKVLAANIEGFLENSIFQ